MSDTKNLNGLILNAAGEGILGLDLEGRHTFVNPAATRMLGFTEDELIGHASHDLWHHTHADGSPYPDTECPVYGAYKVGRVHHGDTEVFWRKDGTSFPVEYTSTPILDDSGNSTGAVVTFRDITSRRVAEQTITDLRRQNEYILNSAGEGIFGLDLEGRHTFVNPAAAVMLGYSADELLGQASHSLWHHTREDGSPYPHEECPIYGAYKDGRVHRGTDERFWRRDGSSFSAQYCSTPLRNEAGQLIGAVVTFQDITEQKRLAAKLLEAAKLAEVTRVLGNVGHDIKNMLMPVITGTSLLQDELTEIFAMDASTMAAKKHTSEKTCKELTEMITSNARRIQDRVREIADAVKGVTSEPHFAPCHVNEVIKGVLKSLQISAKERDVRLLTNGIEQLPVIEADERRLFAALYNLIGNAIPEVPSGGSVTIKGSVSPNGETLELTVADTGKGMPPEVRDRLFTKNAISTKVGGTGLGTKIVKDVIDVHQGTIRVESEENVGTSFHMTIPMKRPKPVTHVSTSEAGQGEQETTGTPAP
ncbi:MAG: PAS domain S-box protein [Nitrospirales bacterium]|nr:PAS domain S-box protein [Nitrospira sp.]MDR4502524.1 PAS domain S-box protein [Nitrospirales bacterium]